MSFSGIFLIIAVLILAVIFFYVVNLSGFIPAVFFLAAVSIFFVLLYFGIISLGQSGGMAVYL